MSINNTVRVMREIHNLTQEEMAEKLNMSLSGYAKIERGETKLSLDKLEQIANIFNMDSLELLQSTNKGVYFLMQNNGDNTHANYYASNDNLLLENEKLKLIIQHKDDVIQSKMELISQKQREIDSLQEIISLLKAK